MKNKPKNETMMDMGPRKEVNSKQSDILEKPDLNKMRFWSLAALGLPYKNLFFREKSSFWRPTSNRVLYIKRYNNN